MRPASTFDHGNAMSYAISRRHCLAGMEALGFGSLAAPIHPLAERLATYADRLRYSDLDAATVEAVKSHLIDALGCAIAAFDERPGRTCRQIAIMAAGGGSAGGGSAAAKGGATIIGTDRRTSPDLTAFANGAAARYYDLTDVYVTRLTIHPSDTIGACLAVANPVGSRGTVGARSYGRPERPARSVANNHLEPPSRARSRLRKYA
jgi:hypothetical protein